MSSDAKKLQPIIVKKVKKGGHAAHGGAWKIAYADFVTAMMAFFLLMWLLGSTTKGDLKGLSDYFSSPLKVALAGGPGSGASDSILPGGGADLTRKSGQAQRASGDERTRKRQRIQMQRIEAAKEDARKLAALSAKISAVISNNPRLAEYSHQIRLQITPDGLLIQIVDDQKRPMFDSGSAVVQTYMREILREIGAALNTVDNKISLDGHTDSSPYSMGERGYSNWELSADRANASRRELVFAGMPDDKLARVVGMASSIPLDPADPLSPINRRISILVMTREAEERLLGVSSLPTEETPDVGRDAPAATGQPAPALAETPESPAQAHGQ